MNDEVNELPPNGSPEANFNTAITLLNQDMASAALIEFELASRGFELIGDWGNVAICNMNIGSLLEEQDALDEALAYLGRASEYFEENEKYEELCEVRLSEGLIFERMHDYSSADANYKDAARLAILSDHKMVQALAAMNLGGLQESRGDVDIAFQSFEQARNLFVQLSLPGQTNECDDALVRLRASAR